MNTIILKQAKKFENEEPVYSSVKKFCELASEYQEENEVFFLDAKRGKRVKVLHFDSFFEFLSMLQDFNLKSFKDIDNILTPKETRKDNILQSGNSKNSFVKVFDGVILIKKIGELPQLYKKEDLHLLDDVQRFVAIENGETFLNIENKAKYFSSDYFVYLSGYSTTLTRTFLKTKSVEFFVDYDIEGMNIYESIECVSKTLHIPKELENYFISQVDNKALYKKQRVNLKEKYSSEANLVIELIKKYSSTVEQEIIYETY